MSIRRLQYQIDHVHILTFKEEYKVAVYPYFSFENVEYAIDNENTIMEGIRLIFKNENIAIFLRKEGLTLLFEGDVEELKNQNGIIRFFWELYEKVKSFKGYTRTTRHALTVHAVNIQDRQGIEELLKNNAYFSKNPFQNVSDFSCIYQFKTDDAEFRFEFGNYSEKDIKTHDLTPFKTKFNEDLIDGFGLMGRLDASEIEKNPTFSKFKTLLSKSEKILSLNEFKLL